MDDRNNLADATQIKVYVGDDLLNLAHAAAKLAYSQTLNLRDLIEPGCTLHVEVAVVS